MSQSKRIQMLMDQHGMKQDDLARITGISQNAVHKILSGKTQKSRFLPDIAKALATTVEYLENGESKKDAKGESELQKSTRVKIFRDIDELLDQVNTEDAKDIKAFVENTIRRRELLDKYD